MNWKNYLILLVITAGTLSALSAIQTVPGYMDAEYYYSMGLRIAKEGLFSEPFIWNYLSDTHQIPHPGFSYWMPLPALVAAAGMKISGWYNFFGARLGMILLSCIIPLLTMDVSYQLTKRPAAGYVAGGLAIFPVFYSVFLTTTDSFAITILLGGLFTRIALIDREDAVPYFFLGLVAGLMHLTRADGLVWAAGGLVFAWISAQRKGMAFGAVAGGYLLIMGPWFARNLYVLGELFPEGNSRMFWLKEYNDLYLYQIEELTFEKWYSQGIFGILGNISEAVVINLKTLIFVQGQLILFPLMLWGGFQHKEKRIVQVNIIIWALIFLVMTAIFPFAGLRGGYFHSGAALQVLLWSFGSVGLLSLIDWGVEKRAWKPERSRWLFATTSIVILVIASGSIYWERVVGENMNDPVWDNSFQSALQIHAAIAENVNRGLVMVNNPPGYYAATGDPSIVIPSGNFDSLLDLANDMDVEYLVLERNHPSYLDEIYLNPQRVEEIIFLGQVDDAYLFQFP